MWIGSLQERGMMRMPSKKHKNNLSLKFRIGQNNDRLNWEKLTQNPKAFHNTKRISDNEPHIGIIQKWQDNNNEI